MRIGTNSVLRDTTEVIFFKFKIKLKINKTELETKLANEKVKIFVRELYANMQIVISL